MRPRPKSCRRYASSPSRRANRHHLPPPPVAPAPAPSMTDCCADTQRVEQDRFCFFQPIAPAFRAPVVHLPVVPPGLPRTNRRCIVSKRESCRWLVAIARRSSSAVATHCSAVPAGSRSRRSVMERQASFLTWYPTTSCSPSAMDHRPGYRHVGLRRDAVTELRASSFACLSANAR